MTTSATPAFFVDTNIFIYAYDARDVSKRDRAIGVIEALTRSGRGILSAQILNEFYTNVTRDTPRRRPLLDPQAARTAVERLTLSWHVLDVEVAGVLTAIRVSQDHRWSYYDALIWATAKLNGVPNILSEDGQDGQTLEGVRRLNPLRTTFDLSILS